MAFTSTLVQACANCSASSSQRTRGTAADPGRDGHEPPPRGAPVPVHVQLTTGDVTRFRDVARRMFGPEFPDVEGIELGVSVG